MILTWNIITGLNKLINLIRSDIKKMLKIFFWCSSVDIEEEKRLLNKYAHWNYYKSFVSEEKNKCEEENNLRL